MLSKLKNKTITGSRKCSDALFIELSFLIEERWWGQVVCPSLRIVDPKDRPQMILRQVKGCNAQTFVDNFHSRCSMASVQCSLVAILIFLLCTYFEHKFVGK